jgi:hypothetical protein
VVVPAAGHVLQLVAHWLRGTPNLEISSTITSPFPNIRRPS